MSIFFSNRRIIPNPYQWKSHIKIIIFFEKKSHVYMCMALKSLTEILHLWVCFVSLPVDTKHIKCVILLNNRWFISLHRSFNCLCAKHHRGVYTAKNPEKDLSFSRKWGFFLGVSIFFSKRRIIRRFEKKDAQFEERILIFEKRTDFFLTIFCSAPNHLIFSFPILPAKHTIFV